MDKDIKLDIIAKPYPEWAKEHPSEIGISKMSITYTQEQDNCSPINRDSEDQYITIEAIGGDLADREGSITRENYYYVINTGRWAINNPEEMYMLMKDFENRLYHTDSNSEDKDE